MNTFTTLSKKYGLKKINKKFDQVFSKDVDISKLSKTVCDLISNVNVFFIEDWYSGIPLTFANGDKSDPMNFIYVRPETNIIFEELKIPLYPIMSRIGILDGNNNFTRNDGWHTDQSPYELLRINIPIITNNNFVFQLDNQLPQHFELGKMYWWDTEIPHRVFSLEKNNVKRLHLVLGFSPWFTYIHKSREWVPNEYFNKIHPLEILKDL